MFFFFIFFILAFITRSWSDLGQAIGASTSRNTTISDPEKGQFNRTIKKKKKNTQIHTISPTTKALSLLCLSTFGPSLRPLASTSTQQRETFLFGYKTVPIKTQKNSSPRCQGINREQPELCFFKDNLQLIIFF